MNKVIPPSMHTRPQTITTLIILAYTRRRWSQSCRQEGQGMKRQQQRWCRQGCWECWRSLMWPGTCPSEKHWEGWMGKVSVCVKRERERERERESTCVCVRTSKCFLNCFNWLYMQSINTKLALRPIDEMKHSNIIITHITWRTLVIMPGAYSQLLNQYYNCSVPAAV